MILQPAIYVSSTFPTIAYGILIDFSTETAEETSLIRSSRKASQQCLVSRSERVEKFKGAIMQKSKLEEKVDQQEQSIDQLPKKCEELEAQKLGS